MDGCAQEESSSKELLQYSDLLQHSTVAALVLRMSSAIWIEPVMVTT